MILSHILLYRRSSILYGIYFLEKNDIIAKQQKRDQLYASFQ